MASQPLLTDPPATGGSTLRDALADAWHDASALLQQHAALASKEARERTAGLGVDVAGLVGGVVLAHVGVLALAAAAGFGLHAAGLPPWLASLVVGVALIGGGLALVSRARACLVARTTRRSETLLALGDTSQWLGELLRGERP